MASRMASITLDQKRPSEIGSLFGPRKRIGRRRFMLHRTPFWPVAVGFRQDRCWDGRNGAWLAPARGA